MITFEITPSDARNSENLFPVNKCIRVLHQAKIGKHECGNGRTMYAPLVLICFHPTKGCITFFRIDYFFLFLESDGVILQSDNQLYFRKISYFNQHRKTKTEKSWKAKGLQLAIYWNLNKIRFYLHVILNIIIKDFSFVQGRLQNIASNNKVSWLLALWPLVKNRLFNFSLKMLPLDSYYSILVLIWKHKWQGNVHIFYIV